MVVIHCEGAQEQGVWYEAKTVFCFMGWSDFCKALSIK
jgi:hypothetical protein